MFHRKESVCQQGLVPQDGDTAPWQKETVQSAADMKRVIETVTASMAAFGFSEEDVFRLHLALEEALANAHHHGHEGNWTKPIALRHHVSENGVVAEIEDQGLGFDPEQVPDPLALENIERPSGRGLFLMRTYMSNVCHNAVGNCICLCKQCPGSTGANDPPP